MMNISLLLLIMVIQITSLDDDKKVDLASNSPPRLTSNITDLPSMTYTMSNNSNRIPPKLMMNRTTQSVQSSPATTPTPKISMTASDVAPRAFKSIAGTPIVQPAMNLDVTTSPATTPKPKASTFTMDLNTINEPTPEPADIISAAMAETNRSGFPSTGRRRRDSADDTVDHSQILANIKPPDGYEPGDEVTNPDRPKFVNNASSSTQLKSPRTRHRELQARKKRHRPRELDDLERLMCKQTILVFITIISSWIFNAGGLFDARLTLLLGVDSCINALCSWLVFKYTNKYWNKCIEGFRCYCCYDCCFNYFGCFLCDADHGCRDCRYCCNSAIQRMGSSVRSLSLRSSSSVHSNTRTPDIDDNMSP